MQLSPKWQKQLAKLPETGMSYQVVRVLLKDGSTRRNIVVIGGKKIVMPEVEPFTNAQIEDISLE